jgi:hypothetical protein
VWGCGGVVVGGGFPLRSNIPRSALCATLDTYNFIVEKFEIQSCFKFIMRTFPSTMFAWV